MACVKTMAQMGGRFLDVKNDAISLRMSRSLRVWSLKPGVSRRVRRVPDKGSVTSCAEQDTVPVVELLALHGSNQHLNTGWQCTWVETVADQGRCLCLGGFRDRGNESRFPGTGWTDH